MDTAMSDPLMDRLLGSGNNPSTSGGGDALLRLAGDVRDSLLRVLADVKDSLETKLRMVAEEMESRLEELEEKVLTEDDLQTICDKIINHVTKDKLPSLIEDAARRAVSSLLPEMMEQIKNLLASVPPPQINVTVPKRQVRKLIEYDQMSRPIAITEVEEASTPEVDAVNTPIGGVEGGI